MALAFAASSCGPLPSVVPPAAEIPRLRARVEAGDADIEASLRLASGLWAQADREGAVRVLEESWASGAETALLAALGTAMEAMGDYPTARDHYLSFVAGTRPSDVSRLLVERTRAIRGETAESLVRRLLGGAQPLESRSSDAVVAVLPLRAPTDDRDLTSIAVVGTELLVLGLRDATTFEVRDWELGQAARAAVYSDTLTVPTNVRSAGELLGSDMVVWGEVFRARGDSVQFNLHALRLTMNGGRSDAAMRTTLDVFPVDRARMVQLGVETAVGAAPGTFYEVAPPADSVPTQALLLMGNGLLALEAGDRSTARALLAQAQELAPEEAPLLDRIAQVESLERFRTSTTLPFIDEILELARMEMSALRLRGVAGGLVSDPARLGVSEAFGLDGLGRQVSLDVIVTTGGSGP